MHSTSSRLRATANRAGGGAAAGACCRCGVGSAGCRSARVDAPRPDRRVDQGRRSGPRGPRPPSDRCSAPGEQHFCTAAVVDSPHRNVASPPRTVSSGTGVGLRFVPGYGPSAAGRPAAGRSAGAYVDRGLAPDAGHLARLRLPRRSPPPTRPTRGRSSEAAVGVGRRACAARPRRRADPSSCSATEAAPMTSRSLCHPRGHDRCQATSAPTVACPGFRAGTSGAPWVERDAQAPATARRTGRRPRIRAVAPTTCRTAPHSMPPRSPFCSGPSAGGPADTLPTPGDDGC